MADWASGASAMSPSQSIGLPVRADDRGRSTVALDDQLVVVGGIRPVGRLKGEVLNDQHVDAQQLAPPGVVGVVEAAGPQPAQHAVAALEVL